MFTYKSFPELWVILELVHPTKDSDLTDSDILETYYLDADVARTAMIKTAIATKNDYNDNDDGHEYHIRQNPGQDGYHYVAIVNEEDEIIEEFMVKWVRPEHQYNVGE